MARRGEGPDDPPHAAGGRFPHRADRCERERCRQRGEGGLGDYRPDATWPLKVTNDFPDKDGWSNIRDYNYQTSPNERRDVGVSARRAGDTWTVVIYDMAQAVGEKRGAQVALIFGRLLPKGLSARDVRRQAGAASWTRAHGRALGIRRDRPQGARMPGVAVGIVQGGKVVFADGFGVSELGGTAKPDGDTMFMIASNTKALTTLMLAQAGRRGQAHVGHAGHAAAAVVQARRCRHDAPRAREEPDLRVHRACRGRTSSGCSSTRA